MTLVNNSVKTKQKFPKKKKIEFKNFWPYIPLVAFLIIGLSLINFLNSSFLNQKSNLSTSSIVSQINQIRQGHHLQPLSVSPSLGQVAKQLNHSIVQQNEKISSINSNQVNVSFGLNQNQKIIQAWQESHLNQILFNPNTKNIGINIQKVNGKYLVSAIGSSSKVISITFKVNPPISQKTIKPQNISIFYELTNNFTLDYYLTGILIILIAFFALRHIVFLKKIVHQGQQLVMRNLWLDFVIIFFILVILFLTLKVGFVI